MLNLPNIFIGEPVNFGFPIAIRGIKRRKALNVLPFSRIAATLLA